MPRLLPILVLAARLPAQPTCSGCHPAQSALHNASNHHRTLRPAADTEFARALPGAPIGEARDGFLLSYSPSGSSLLVTATRGSSSATGQIDWILGAGDQGLTPLIQVRNQWLEHRISFYTKPERFDLTLGHAPGASRSATAALGIPQPAATLRACLGCHAKLAPNSLTILAPGVTCDRCHAATAKHFSSPAKLSPRAQVELCATCHRLHAPGRADDPLNIRFQPLRLIQSQCYRSGNITCTTCHPAHRDAVRANPAFYRTQCQSCHKSPHARQNTDCLPCHMPKSRPAPYLDFTDHWIRLPPPTP